MKKIIYVVVVISIAFTTAFSYNILVWDKDDKDTFKDVESRKMVGSEANLIYALKEIGETPKLVRTLPAVLSGYDVIFICTGWYSC
ncbi:MAG: hypothetical protein ACUVWP_04550 [bacterium]